MVDTIVIGGGIVGASAAYHLAKGGAKTLLVDRHDPGRATDAGAGILSPETSGIGIAEAWFPFAVECVDYYTILMPLLYAEQDGDTGYAVCGKLTVAVDDDEVEAFNHARERIFARQKQRGLPSVDDLYEISSEEAQQMFPPLAPVKGAIYYRGGARVDGRLLNAALLRAAARYNLERRQASVERLVMDGKNVTGVVVDGATITASRVIIAGGAWTPEFATQLGVEIPVRPQRGQIIHLTLPDADTADFPIVVAFHGHYIVAWEGGRIVVGATRELGVGFNRFTTADGIREVLGEATRVAPGLGQAQFQEIRVGLRPHTEDHLPVLGEVPNIANVYLCTGHGASGLQLGPYSGKLAADWALGNPVKTDIAAFHVTRFKS